MLGAPGPGFHRPCRGPRGREAVRRSCAFRRIRRPSPLEFCHLVRPKSAAGSGPIRPPEPQATHRRFRVRRPAAKLHLRRHARAPSSAELWPRIRGTGGLRPRRLTDRAAPETAKRRRAVVGCRLRTEHHVAGGRVTRDRSRMATRTLPIPGASPEMTNEPSTRSSSSLPSIVLTRAAQSSWPCGVPKPCRGANPMAVARLR